MDGFAAAAIGVATGMTVQVISIWLRYSLERHDRDAIRREEQREVIAIIRHELATLTETVEHLSAKVDSLPCGGRECSPPRSMIRNAANI